MLAVGLVTLGCTKLSPAPPERNRILCRGETPCGDGDIIMNRETNRTAVEELSFVGWTDGHYNLRYGDVKDRKCLPANLPFGGERTIEHLWELEWFTSLEEIQPYEFFRCSGLRVVALPPSLRRIGSCAFSGCGALDSLYLRCQAPPELAPDTFGVRVPVIIVPGGTRKDYVEASGWGAFGERIVEANR